MLNVAGEANEKIKRISIDLPIELIDGVDQLRKEWGLRRRGAVFERLLEVILSNEKIDDKDNSDLIEDNNFYNLTTNDEIDTNSESIYEEKALVIIGNSDIKIKDIKKHPHNTSNSKNIKDEKNVTGIELPGFIRRQTNNLKRSLSKNKNNKNIEDTSITIINIDDLINSKKEAEKHWIYLYGQKPTENVLEASMIWLARDIWPHVDGTENIPFTWNAACKIMNSYCQSWEKDSITFQDVIVMAGVLEDPFSTRILLNRIPTIIRRFVNKFKRSQNVTSFQTLESTMTVHGALKLLDLPTKAGSSLTLSFIRDAYKQKALSNHPDAGGSNENMRRLNEAYQMLKDLYKNNV